MKPSLCSETAVPTVNQSSRSSTRGAACGVRTLYARAVRQRARGGEEREFQNRKLVCTYCIEREREQKREGDGLRTREGGGKEKTQLARAVKVYIHIHGASERTGLFGDNRTLRPHPVASLARPRPLVRLISFPGRARNRSTTSDRERRPFSTVGFSRAASTMI